MTTTTTTHTRVTCDRVDSNTTAATQHETLRSPNSKHSNLFEQKAGHFCVRSLQKKRVQKALQKGEQFLNTTKICCDFYKREQHQKTKKIAELSDPSNRILIYLYTHRLQNQEVGDPLHSENPSILLFFFGFHFGFIFRDHQYCFFFRVLCINPYPFFVFSFFFLADFSVVFRGFHHPHPSPRSLALCSVHGTARCVLSGCKVSAALLPLSAALCRTLPPPCRLAAHISNCCCSPICTWLLIVIAVCLAPDM